MRLVGGGLVDQWYLDSNEGWKPGFVSVRGRRFSGNFFSNSNVYYRMEDVNLEILYRLELSNEEDVLIVVWWSLEWWVKEKEWRLKMRETTRFLD